MSEKEVEAKEKSCVIKRLRSVEKLALIKAVGVLMLSWASLPLLYYMFKKRGEEK